MHILGDPGAASLFGAMFSGESLFERQKSPWKLTLTEPVSEIFEFVPLIGQKSTISEEFQPGNFVAFLHDVVFLFDWREKTRNEA